MNSPRHFARRIVLIAVAGVTLWALSGCIKVDLAATIRGNDSVDGQMTAAVHTDAIEAIGSDEAQEFVDSLIDDFPGGYERHDYDDGEFVGETVQFANVDLMDFNDSGDADTGEGRLQIVHSGDAYTLNGEWNLPQPAGGTIDELDDSVIDRADFTIAITFPGTVTQHNGQLSGKTVTWQLQLGQDNIMYAQAGESSSVKAAWIVLAISLGLMLLAMVALFIQLRRHSVGRAKH